VSGLLASPSNHEEYAQNIKSLLADKTYTHLISQSARQRVQKLFSADKIAQETISYYKELIK